MTSDAKRAQAWRRLLTGESLTDLSLPKKDGRIDFSGLVLPQPKVLERRNTILIFPKAN